MNKVVLNIDLKEVVLLFELVLIFEVILVVMFKGLVIELEMCVGVFVEDSEVCFGE